MIVALYKTLTNTGPLFYMFSANCFPLFKCTVIRLLNEFGLLEEWRSYEFMLARPSVRLSVTSFSWNWLISFF